MRYDIGVTGKQIRKNEKEIKIMSMIINAVKNYFTSNTKMINAGLLLLNGNVDAYGLYKSMR